jgi:hypothetical protein
MSDNKFILQLKGSQTPKSVFEIKNDKLVAPFTGVRHSTDVVGSIIDDKDSSVVVAKGAQNWKLDGSSLVVASSLSGDGADYTGEFNVSGSGLWINAMYSLPTTIFSAGTKWALKLCGKNLLTTSGQTIGFTLVVKIGNTHITSKTFTVAEGANVFCRQLVIDFSESEQAIIKAQSGDSLTVQLLCSDTNASATIYNGMTVFTALQRRVDADVVASDEKTFDDVVQDIDDINDDIEQIHEDIDDLEDYVDDTFVRLDGESIMTGPLKMRATSSFQCAIAPFWDGVGFYKLNSDNSVTLIASIETPDGFVPWTTNTYNIGSSLKKWKNLYLGGKLFASTINNGGDLVVPNVAGTLATMGDVELAARSGTQLTDQGVWYARMDPRGIIPSYAEVEGRNYADFTQDDGRGNRLIVIYTYTQWRWKLTETITAPAEYDGYVLVTSKIWDIAEQAGQQGGRVLWNHRSKEFTPYPQIISFENIEVTGESTVVMPQNPSASQIVNKDYVDEAIAAIPTPTVDIAQSIDADIVGTLTVASNGDVSGLDNSNYLVYPGTLDMSDASSFEMVFAFTTANAVSSAYILTSVGMGYGSEHNTAITINNSEKLYFYVNASDDTITGTTTIQPNTKYYVKVVCDGTNYIMSLSEDGNNWSVEGSVLVTEKPGFLLERKYVIGKSVFSAMHMKECYIKENGILVWQGLGDPGLHQRVSKAEADYVVETQFPTLANNYTWYRKYKSGWVEQGQRSLNIANQSHNLYTLPVPMADTDYWAAAGPAQISSSEMYNAASTVAALAGTTTQVRLGQFNTANSTMRIWWEVRGMAA